MKEGLDIQAPANEDVGRALAFGLRAISVGVFVWLVLHALAAIRWW